ncbi:hypothetical protein [Butyrivibrio sp. NC2002]|uniref:hypothetical protein n=1 Tax=Butyrivibrio sp. NC2002 TaxID=1410610 RepID=UPI000AA51DE6|nr:hypothetical protein [Butyrivibrio sp. NC2002]
MEKVFYCHDCNISFIQDGDGICPRCGKKAIVLPVSVDQWNALDEAGKENVKRAAFNNRESNSQVAISADKKVSENGKKTESISRTLYVVAAVMYIICSAMLYKGYDKLTNYYNSENYISLNKNAYVGGDAYNYIINGTYATSFFVLAMGFLITGTLFILGGIYFKNKK